MKITSHLLRSTAVGALGGLLFGFDTVVIFGTTGQLTTLFHLSPAALDSAIRLLDQPFSVQSFGDILETGRVSEEKING